MIKSRKTASRSKSVKEPKTKTISARKLAARLLAKELSNNSPITSELQKVHSGEDSTQAEPVQLEKPANAYSSRLRERKPVRKLSFDERADSSYDESDDYMCLGKRGKKKRKNKRNSNGPRINDQNFSRLEKVIDWRRHYVEPMLIPESYQEYETNCISNEQLDDYGKDFQAIWINIDWRTHNLKDLINLNISPKLLKNGIVFMWSDKGLLAEIIDIMAQKKFKYIENVCIAKIDSKSILGNKTAEGDTRKKFLELMPHSLLEPTDCFLHDTHNTYFRTCKKVLLMFHRNLGAKENLELRHQRNSDAFFDLYPTQTSGQDEIGKERIYILIETLLPKAVTTNKNELKLLELYATPGLPRTGWVTVVESQS
jgi:hypothetical protein